MAKKRASSAKKSTSRTKPGPEKTAESPAPAGPFERLGRRLDELPETRALKDAIGAFQAEVDSTRQRLEQSRRAARSRAGAGKTSTDEADAGLDETDLWDHTMQYVRNNPFRSIFAALLTGLLLGRLWRR